MAVNYVKMAALAQKLIDANGRDVVVRERAQLGAVINPEQPWRGNNSAAPSDDGGPISLTVPAVILNYDDKVVVGDLVKRGVKFAYVAQNDALDDENNPYDLRLFSQLVDGSEIWEFSDVELIAPGNIPLMYILHLKQ